MSTTDPIEFVAHKQHIQLQQWLTHKMQADRLDACSSSITAATYDEAEVYAFTVYVHRSNICKSGTGPSLAAAYDDALLQLLKDLVNQSTPEAPPPPPAPPEWAL